MCRKPPNYLLKKINSKLLFIWCRLGRDCMVVGFITAYAISA